MFLTAVSGIFCPPLFWELGVMTGTRVLTSHVAHNSRDISQVHGSRVVGPLQCLHGTPQTPFEQSVLTDEPVSYPSTSPVLIIFFLEEAFSGSNGRTMLAVSVAFRARELARTRNSQQLVFSFILFDCFLSFSTSAPFSGV